MITDDNNPNRSGIQEKLLRLFKEKMELYEDKKLKTIQDTPSRYR